MNRSKNKTKIDKFLPEHKQREHSILICNMNYSLISSLRNRSRTLKSFKTRKRCLLYYTQ